VNCTHAGERSGDYLLRLLPFRCSVCASTASQKAATRATIRSGAICSGTEHLLDQGFVLIMIGNDQARAMTHLIHHIRSVDRLSRDLRFALAAFNDADI